MSLNLFEEPMIMENSNFLQALDCIERNNKKPPQQVETKNKTIIEREKLIEIIKNELGEANISWLRSFGPSLGIQFLKLFIKISPMLTKEEIKEIKSNSIIDSMNNLKDIGTEKLQNKLVGLLDPNGKNNIKLTSKRDILGINFKHINSYFDKSGNEYIVKYTALSDKAESEELLNNLNTDDEIAHKIFCELVLLPDRTQMFEFYNEFGVVQVQKKVKIVATEYDFNNQKNKKVYSEFILDILNKLIKNMNEGTWFKADLHNQNIGIVTIKGKDKMVLFDCGQNNFRDDMVELTIKAGLEKKLFTNKHEIKEKMLQYIKLKKSFTKDF